MYFKLYMKVTIGFIFHCCKRNSVAVYFSLRCFVSRSFVHHSWFFFFALQFFGWFSFGRLFTRNLYFFFKHVSPLSPGGWICSWCFFEKNVFPAMVQYFPSIECGTLSSLSKRTMELVCWTSFRKVQISRQWFPLQTSVARNQNDSCGRRCHWMWRKVCFVTGTSKKNKRAGSWNWTVPSTGGGAFSSPGAPPEQHHPINYITNSLFSPLFTASSETCCIVRPPARLEGTPPFSRGVHKQHLGV